jgi:hypothetical protein
MNFVLENQQHRKVSNPEIGDYYVPPGIKQSLSFLY